VFLFAHAAPYVPKPAPRAPTQKPTASATISGRHHFPGIASGLLTTTSGARLKKGKKKKQGKKQASEPAVNPVKLPSSDPAARDEGPRLIPLKERPSDHPTLDKYISLADKALGDKGSKKQD
jgi:hypothetical protein